MRTILLICGCIGLLIILSLIVSDEFNYDPYQGHTWYIRPMAGRTVQLYNGSVFYVTHDFWDSCEHNPDQQHFIGVGFTNKTLYEERTLLDQNPRTRNFIETHKTILWINANLVYEVLP